MRVIAGEFKGRPIKAVPGDKTRPTLDKTKESIFNAIGQYFESGVVLDLYAGSGNLGIEALSRGCDFAYFVDKSYQAVQIIKENLNTLGLEDYAKVFKLDAFGALKKFKTDGVKFDYVFLDPPYKQQRINDVMTFLMDEDMLIDGAMIICEALKEDVLLESYQDLTFIKDYIYGITKISLYQKG